MYHILLLALIAAAAVQGQCDQQFAAVISTSCSPNGGQAWTVSSMRCQGAPEIPCLSTLPSGEAAIGSVASADFACPSKLSFWLSGHSRQQANSVSLVDAATNETYRVQPVPGDDIAHKYDWDLADCAGKKVKLVLQDGDNGSGWAWMSFGGAEPSVVDLPTCATGPIPPGWHDIPSPEVRVDVDGIPFIQRECWSPAKEGDTARLEFPPLQAKYICILGCVNSHDEAYGNWGGADDYCTLSVGDKCGDIRIGYADGSIDTIPMILGYTLWLANVPSEPFTSDPSAKKSLEDMLFLANAAHQAPPYYLRIALRDKPVSSITLTDSPAKRGHSTISGLTFAGITGQLGDTPAIRILSGGEAPADTQAWVDRHTISSADPYPASIKKLVDNMAHRLYTYPSDITDSVIASVKPDVTAKNYAGPKVTFTGTPEAMILTNVYYENSQEILGRVDDDTGMLHESGPQAPNFNSFGPYFPGMQPFYNASYTRIRSLMLLSNTGFFGKAEKGLDYYDHWMMYYPESYPKLQMGGKPVPGHASVIANQPHIYPDVLSKGGWPTRYKIRDYGNPETDGHGMLMLSHWREWVKRGKPADWINKRWAAINEAAEYIPWCLANPDLSFSEHGLLYAESEGGMCCISLHCNIPCWLGLLAYAEMADAAGHPDKAARWRKTADDMKTAMEAYFPINSEQWGDVWDSKKTADWIYYHSALAPVIQGMDLLGYDAAQLLPTDWRTRTLNTYKMQLTKNKPAFCAPAGIGYGQCYITQSGLLLDQMADATQMVNWTAHICFSPRMPHPYRVPEMTSVASDGSRWRRQGDLGNLYQLSEVVYTTHIIIGIDDLDNSNLKLMPRIPRGWTGMAIKDWPVRTNSNGQSVLTNLSMDIKRDSARKSFDMSIKSDKPIDSLNLRLGPFPTKTKHLSVTVDKKPVTVSLKTIGDSKWGWLKISRSNNFRIQACAENAKSKIKH